MVLFNVLDSPGDMHFRDVASNFGSESTNVTEVAKSDNFMTEAVTESSDNSIERYIKNLDQVIRTVDRSLPIMERFLK